MLEEEVLISPGRPSEWRCEHDLSNLLSILMSNTILRVKASMHIKELNLFSLSRLVLWISQVAHEVSSMATRSWECLSIWNENEFVWQLNIFISQLFAILMDFS